MTQHQAPEVTSEDVERVARAIATGCNLDPNAMSPKAKDAGHEIPEWLFFANAAQLAITAWNTRATQPLSLTVDPVLAFEEYWGASKYRTRNMIGYSDKKCLAWEAYSAALQSLSLPGDIDRSGLAQEVE